MLLLLVPPKLKYAAYSYACLSSRKCRKCSGHIWNRHIYSAHIYNCACFFVALTLKPYRWQHAAYQAIKRLTLRTKDCRSTSLTPTVRGSSKRWVHSEFIDSCLRSKEYVTVPRNARRMRKNLRGTFLKTFKSETLHWFLNGMQMMIVASRDTILESFEVLTILRDYRYTASRENLNSKFISTSDADNNFHKNIECNVCVNVLWSCNILLYNISSCKICCRDIFTRYYCRPGLLSCLTLLICSNDANLARKDAEDRKSVV